MLGGSPRLRSIDFDLTYRCPCKCEQCYSDDYLAPEPGLLTVEEIARCVEQAVALGAVHVNLTGGEPLLRGGLEGIVEIAAAKGTLVSICSSGAGLKAGRLDGLIEAGLGLAIFSVDSVDPEVHDRNRGIPGLHERVLGLIDHGRRRGLKIIVNTVATAGKLESNELRRLLRLVQERGATLNLTIPTPCGRWDGNEEVLLSDAQRGQLREFLDVPGVRTDTSSTYWGRGCPAGNEKLAIGAYGDVRSCQLIPRSFGNVRTATLAEIWAGMIDEPIRHNRDWFCPAADREFRAAHPDYFEEPESDRGQAV
jgi:MoaA/NifB/PqqE/SkfB family radical SAM enzyme